MMNIDKAINEHLTVKFSYVDLFYAYCNAKGYDDPENDIESDEKYDELEKEFESKITDDTLYNLGVAIMQDGMERISRAMESLNNKGE